VIAGAGYAERYSVSVKHWIETARRIMVALVGTLPPLSRWLVASCDRGYRFFYSLDTSASEVGPTVRIEVRRSHRTLHLADGTTIRPCDRVGVLHLNNDRVVGLHADGVSRLAVGLEFRRQMLASLTGEPFQVVGRG